jgi:hypothetical protein
MWEPVIKTFSENYRVYALDNIYDFGRSIYTKQMKNSKDFSNWLNELFATLELGSNINLITTVRLKVNKEVGLNPLL